MLSDTGNMVGHPQQQLHFLWIYTVGQKV